MLSCFPPLFGSHLATPYSIVKITRLYEYQTWQTFIGVKGICLFFSWLCFRALIGWADRLRSRGWILHVLAQLLQWHSDTNCLFNFILQHCEQRKYTCDGQTTTTNPFQQSLVVPRRNVQSIFNWDHLTWTISEVMAQVFSWWQQTQMQRVSDGLIYCTTSCTHYLWSYTVNSL